MTKKKTKTHTWANPARAKAMAELRRSSASSPHDTRPNRNRTRQTAKATAINDYKRGA